jgi:hypothetical protein
MLKQLTALFILLSFTLTVFDKAYVLVDYYFNTASYARNCENKMQPMMHCNGKCQMMKKFKAEEKRQQQNPERRAENKNEVVSCRSFFPSMDIQYSTALEIISPINQTLFPLGSRPSVFHPPA